MSVRQMMMGRKPAAGGGSFDPIAGVGWAHAYWTEGDAFAALAYGPDAAVSLWPDEVATVDLSTVSGREPLHRSTGGPNGTPCVQGQGDAADNYLTGSFAAALTQPYTVVLVAIGQDDGLNGRFFDGVASTSILDELGAGGYLLNAGSSVTGGTEDSSPHLFACLFNGASSLVERDGSTLISGNAGSNTMSGLTLFSSRSPYTTRASSHKITFAGIYDGDARSDPGWADFETWTETHYGLTVA